MSVLSMQTAQPASSHLDRVLALSHTSHTSHTQILSSKTVSPVAEVSVSEETKVETKVETEVDPESIPPPPKTIPERAAAAATVLNRYRIEYTNEWDNPASISYAQTQIETALERDEPIQLVLPAFPFKSSNRSKKVLGRFPDEAERLSLLHLNGLCLGIKDVAEADAYLTIVSDGVVYNDILGVSDEDVWDYGQSLREMAAANNCQYIRFARISDLVGAGPEGPGPEADREATTTMSKEQYLEQAALYRDLIQARVPEGFDVVDAIANDVNINKTYTGYKKFLMSEREERPGRSRSQMERENAAIAKKMVTRGKAFAEIVKQAFAGSVRLSIHPSNDTNKISIKMLPQDNAVVMTPWHGAVVRGADGSVSMTHALSVPAMSHELIYTSDGTGTGTGSSSSVRRRPSYFRERSDVFDWPGMDLTFEWLYPCGVIIRPAGGAAAAYTLSMVDMQKVRRLAETCSPVVLRGFANTRDKRTFLAKAYDLGEIFVWKSVITVVKDATNNNNNEDNSNTNSNESDNNNSNGNGNGRRKRGRGNVAFTSEAMPMHYDGIFKIATSIDEATGLEKKIPDPPRMQYFVCQTTPGPSLAPTTSQDNNNNNNNDDRRSGHTLFASSDLFARYLPRAHSIERLEKLRWTCHSYGHFPHVLTDMPLVERHPTRGTPCLRWHEPWPRWRSPSGFHHARVSIDNNNNNNNVKNGSQTTQQQQQQQRLVSLIDSLLYDRRVCLRFAWHEGDVLVSDNVAMLHTRTAFDTTLPRELWRVHTY